jgi:ATP-dependent DNA ligase
MLLRSGRLPTGDYAYEPKWDGFRALISRNGHLRVKSRRGWDMTSLLPELSGLPDGIAVDGELVAFGDDGLPSFPRLCDRMLHGKRRIEVMLIVFDVLAIDRRDMTRRPYWETPATARRPSLGRRLLVDHAQLHRRRTAMGKGLPTRPGRRRHEETQRPLPPRPARLDQDQEPHLLAVRA